LETSQLLDRSAVILAGGFSKRFGQDKGLIKLIRKPLITHVLNAVERIVDERLVVLSSKTQAENYLGIVSSDIKVLVDKGKVQSPLVGAFTGFREARGKYTLLLPCDTPFVSKGIISLLFEICIGRNAVIPRWPNDYIEPLQAVYCTKPALEAARKALDDGSLNMRGLINRLNSVRYISTMVLQQLDPKLTTFFNINTPLDIRKAEHMLKRQNP
jgi:molybdopterin-guanine dinucleotide biosynthesis protein A